MIRQILERWGKELLQWGRARASAEISFLLLSSAISIPLQWGRARASAEITRNRFPCGVQGRFNGAALVRARKCRSTQFMHWPKNTASMGPRSCERGNSGDSSTASVSCSCFNGAALVRARKWCLWATFRVGLEELQWGRARASAEIAGARRCARLTSGFNGAALVRARKCAFMRC